MAGTKSKSQAPLIDSLETGRELVRSLRKPSTKWLADEATESGKTLLGQLLGLESYGKTHSEQTSTPEQNDKNQGKHKNVEIFNSSKHQESKAHGEKTQRAHIEAAIDYHGKFRNEIVKSRERASKGEMREMQRNVEQIKQELSRLISSSQVLKMEFAQISIEQPSTSVGQYHINFFEWILSVIRSARQKVEDSGAWLGAVKGKGAKRGYWGMFKKHGTMFGLSGERAVATQVG